MWSEFRLFLQNRKLRHNLLYIKRFRIWKRFFNG